MVKMLSLLAPASENRDVQPSWPSTPLKTSSLRGKMKFDIADYSQLTVNEVFSGYLNQVHSSRDLEIDMVKQMQQKYEVWLPALNKLYTYPANPQVY